jgi:hypothetical protein
MLLPATVGNSVEPDTAFGLKKVRIGYLDRPHIVVRDDHAGAALREMPKGIR